MNLVAKRGLTQRRKGTNRIDYDYEDESTVLHAEKQRGLREAGFARVG
jgi:hypothetical protein